MRDKIAGDETSMLKTGSAAEPVKIAEDNGITIYHINTDKFKTNTVHVFFDSNISEGNATMNALLPAVMRRGCGTLPSFRDIARRLEELYGASFDCGINKKGERHIIYFHIEYINDKYTINKTKLFKEVLDLLGEILLEPVKEGDGFRDDYLRQEKANLESMIRSRINNKVQYAVERCMEEMCANEPYAIYEYGRVSDLERISREGLYRHYREVLEIWPVSIYMTGVFDDEQIDYAKTLFCGIAPRKPGTSGPAAVNTQPERVKHVEEKQPVNQGKLSLGFRTNTGPADDDYYPLLVYNGILGGGIHSKFFRNVREKAGIAYYAFSRLEKFKGLMAASCGIEHSDRKKAESIMLTQVEEIAEGNISDYEFNATIKSIETGIDTLKDSQPGIVEFYFGQYIAGSNDTFDSLLEKVRAVTPDDAAGVAGKVKLDTVYYLSPEERKQEKESGHVQDQEQGRVQNQE